jgi:hypothetical protein
LVSVQAGTDASHPQTSTLTRQLKRSDSVETVQGAPKPPTNTWAYRSSSIHRLVVMMALAIDDEVLAATEASVKPSFTVRVTFASYVTSGAISRRTRRYACGGPLLWSDADGAEPSAGTPGATTSGAKACYRC